MVFGRDIPAFAVTSFTQTLPKSGLHKRPGRAEIHESDNRHRRLLRIRREWSCGGCTEKREECAPLHLAAPESPTATPCAMTQTSTLRQCHEREITHHRA